MKTRSRWFVGPLLATLFLFSILFFEVACSSSSSGARNYSALVEEQMCQGTKNFVSQAFHQHLWRTESEIYDIHRNALFNALMNRFEALTELHREYLDVRDLHEKILKSSFDSSFSDCSLFREIDQFFVSRVKKNDAESNLFYEWRFLGFPTVYHEYVDYVLRQMDAFSRLSLVVSGENEASYGFRYRDIEYPSGASEMVVTTASPESPLKVGDLLLGISAPYNDVGKDPEVFTWQEWKSRGLARRQMLRALDSVTYEFFKVRIERDGIQKEIVIEALRKNAPLIEVRDLGDSGLSIYLSEFGINAADEIAAALKDAAASSEKPFEDRPLILDLRGNPGGDVLEAIKIMRLFIGDRSLGFARSRSKLQTVTSQTLSETEVRKGFNGESDHFGAKALTEPATYFENPLFILVDNESASASEIVSLFLQSLKRALIIGPKTFGKGIGQSSRYIEGLDAIGFVTSKQFYDESGKSIQREGQIADIPLVATTKSIQASDLDEDKMKAAGPNVTPLQPEPSPFRKFRLEVTSRPGFADFKNRFINTKSDAALDAVKEVVLWLNQPQPMGTALR